MKKIILDENGNIEDENPLKAELDAREKEIEAERAARIARQREPEVYIPDPAQPDLPFNQNQVSDFEYNYGDIAFFGGVLLLIVSVLVVLYKYFPPL